MINDLIICHSGRVTIGQATLSHVTCECSPVDHGLVSVVQDHRTWVDWPCMLGDLTRTMNWSFVITELYSCGMCKRSMQAWCAHAHHT